MLATYVEQIDSIWRNANSEAKLEGELNQLLKELLRNYDVDYDPLVNYSLSPHGSTMRSVRPDSLFGHVILDYKKPGSLSSSKKLEIFKKQVIQYLNHVNDGGHSSINNQCDRWAGILWDGKNITFCRSDSDSWSWSSLYPNSEASLGILAQCYRALQRKPLTGELLTKYFGNGSEMADRAVVTLYKSLSNPTPKTEMLYKEWKRIFEQVSTYELSQLPSLAIWAKHHNLDNPNASKIIFCMHTYYSLIVKFLAIELLIANIYSDPTLSQVERIIAAQDIDGIRSCLAAIESNSLFRGLGLVNFLEGDFFSWYLEEFHEELAAVVKDIALILQEFEPATAKLMPTVIRDLLKQFYSGLVNEQIRHDLGEFYTPDWLAEYLLDAAGYDGNPDTSVLDPTCGSGTFLIECIKRVKDRCAEQNIPPANTLELILKNIRGLDLNPLAVISARTNYILAISDLITSYNGGNNIEIPVFLADSINIPLEKNGCFEYVLETKKGNIDLRFPSTLIKAQLLGRLLLLCEELINAEWEPKKITPRLLSDIELKPFLNEESLQLVINFYTAIYELHTMRPAWNGIWCRVVKNNYSPSGFGKFDLIIGNPPWVRWSRLPINYRERVKAFCHYYGLVSGQGFTGGIESDIATVITFSAADHWLKIGGKIAFLITGTVFKTASATGFRKGILPDTNRLKPLQIEDMSRVQLFSDATNETAIYIAEKTAEPENYNSISSVIWKPTGSPRIDSSLTLIEALTRVERENVEAFHISEALGAPLYIGARNKFTTLSNLRGKSYYFDRARRGTVSDFARIYWVKVKSYSRTSNRALICTLSEIELPRAQKISSVSGAWIEADLLHPLMRGRDVGRYGWKTQEWYQIIPNDHYSNITAENDFAIRYPLAYQYFLKFKCQLLNRSSYNRYQRDTPFYSIFCVGEYSFAQYKVVWPELQNPETFRAAAVITSIGDLPNKIIVPDHKLYFVTVESEVEAHYISSVLNSRPIREYFGGFLLSKNIGTSVFEYLKVPKYTSTNKYHNRIAQIGASAAQERYSLTEKRFISDHIEEELEDLIFSIFKD